AGPYARTIADTRGARSDPNDGRRPSRDDLVRSQIMTSILTTICIYAMNRHPDFLIPPSLRAGRTRKSKPARSNTRGNEEDCAVGHREYESAVAAAALISATRARPARARSLRVG